MAVTHTTAARNALANIICSTSAGQVGANWSLVIYSGTAPANAQAALSGNTAISTLPAGNFGAAAAGVSTVTGITSDTNAVGGTATFFRILASGTPVFQGSVTATGGGGDLTLPNVVIPAAITVSLTSGTYTAPL